jgi:hypothetical protein
MPAGLHPVAPLRLAPVTLVWASLTWASLAWAWPIWASLIGSRLAGLPRIEDDRRAGPAATWHPDDVSPAQPPE